MSAQVILSEVALDPSRFQSVKHFTSWLGRCPGTNITGSKVKTSRTRPVVNQAANAFRMVAQTAGKSNSALGAVISSPTFSPCCSQGHYCYFEDLS